jgi:hypothetical protein
MGCIGARKLWHQLQREGIVVARCTVERLMKADGLHGVLRGTKIRTTRPDPAVARPEDLVERQFSAQLPGATFAYAAPTMFATGDLPLITGSGVDPAVLKWTPWHLRHSAAFSPSASHVLQIIEAGLSGDIDPDRLQTSDGQDQLQAYFGRIAEWVSAPVPDQEPSEEEMSRLFGPGPGTQT